MWVDVDADNDFDADVPVVVSSVDHLGGPLLDTDLDVIAENASVRVDGSIAFAEHLADGLVGRVTVAGGVDGLRAQHLDEPDGWDVVDARVVGADDDEMDEALA